MGIGFEFTKLLVKDVSKNKNVANKNISSEDKG